MQPTTSGPSRASPSPFSSVITGHCLCGALTVTVAAPHMASRLVVTIEAMQVLPITEAGGVFAWLRALDWTILGHRRNARCRAFRKASFCLPSLGFSAAMSPSSNPSVEGPTSNGFNRSSQRSQQTAIDP